MGYIKPCLMLLQMTAFAARLALDCQRVQAGRVDCAPCIQLNPDQLQSDSTPASDSTARASLAAPGIESMTSQIEIPTRPPFQTTPSDQGAPKYTPPGASKMAAEESYPAAASSSEQHPAVNGTGESFPAWTDHESESGQVYGVSPALHSYMQRVHAPLLAKPLVKLLVLAVFAGAAVLSLAAIPHVSRCALLAR